MGIFYIKGDLKMKKHVFSGMLALGLTFVGLTTSSFAAEQLDPLSIESIKEVHPDVEVQNQLIEKLENGEMLDSNNPEKKSLGETEYIDAYTTVTTFPDGSRIIQGVDFSEATFYDEEGNEIEKNSDEILVTPLATEGVSGGTWTSGSGYSCVTGAKVHEHKYGITIDFKADFCMNHDTYDNLKRVYGVEVVAYDWDILGEGVFRPTETSEYSAYGGVKVKARYSETSDAVTDYLYLRVGDDDYWLDTSL